MIQDNSIIFWIYCPILRRDPDQKLFLFQYPTMEDGIISSGE